MILSNSTLQSYRDAVREDRTRLLSDLVNISQTPAPTFDEQERADLMERRFREEDINNVYRDPEGNVVAPLGDGTGPTVCLCAHLDTVFDRSVNHTVHLDDREIRGPSVGDDSLGLATLLSMVRLLPEDEVTNLILVATTGTEGDGNLRGARYFIENCRSDIDFTFCLEGHRLGRIDHWSLGNNRLRIHVESQGGHVWRDRHKTGENPIEVLCQLVGQLRALKDEARETDEDVLLNFGMIRGGSAYNTVPYEGDLNVEVRSRNADLLEDLFNRLFSTVERINNERDVTINVREVTRRPVSGIPGDHWLVDTMESVHRRLGIDSVKGPASSDGCVFLDSGIPTLTLGLARGENKHRTNESLAIDSLETGQLQVLTGILSTFRSRVEEPLQEPVAD